MKRYKITWYVGSVEKVESEIKVANAKEEMITKVNYLNILPEGLRKKVMYERVIYYNDDLIVIDYGSYSNFIKVEELNERKKEI